MDKSQKHKREYDMFGPWIFQIESADDVPDAFEPYFRYDETVEFAIKIPHHVERRNGSSRRVLSPRNRRLFPLERGGEKLGR